jgi:mannitol/fructose-specific phosphotransferase system IIA component (Ntr-type)
VTKKPSIETGNITQNNQKIEFNPLEHKGTIDIKVTTPNGNTQSLTDAQITEIFKNESFRKELERIISESKMNTNYGTVPNKI